MKKQSVLKIKKIKKNPWKKKGAKNENGQVEDIIISDKTPEENKIISNIGVLAELRYLKFMKIKRSR